MSQVQDDAQSNPNTPVTSPPSRQPSLGHALPPRAPSRGPLSSLPNSPQSPALPISLPTNPNASLQSFGGSSVGSPPLVQEGPRRQSVNSEASVSVLVHKSSKEGLDFLQETHRVVNELKASVITPSGETATSRSTRPVNDYASSRGSPSDQGMHDANEESVEAGQVWRPAAITVRDALLKTNEVLKKNCTIYPFVALPSVIRPQCAIVLRDIYDCNSVLNCKLSKCTSVELAAAGRTAYNWLNNRHRTVISENPHAYIESVIKVITTGRPKQHESCAITGLKMCFNPPNEEITPSPYVVKLLSDWIIYEHLEQKEKKKTSVSALLDHNTQIAMIHLQGQWAGDITLRGHKRRRSEVLNYVPHNTVVYAYEEIRTCPCQAERIMTSFVSTTVNSEDVLIANNVLKKPGLVRFRASIIILGAYIAILVGTAIVVIWLSVKSASDGFKRITGVLTGWSWSLALVSAVHFIIVKNLLPGTTLQHLFKLKRQATDLSNMKLNEGTRILLAQDARTNHLLAPGNSCAFANRPSGNVQVDEMPTVADCIKLGLLVTDTFAIKLQQNTPLLRKTVENLDGSIHVEWDEPIVGCAVGRLLVDDIRVGNRTGEYAKEIATGDGLC